MITLDHSQSQSLSSWCLICLSRETRVGEGGGSEAGGDEGDGEGDGGGGAEEEEGEGGDVLLLAGGGGDVITCVLGLSGLVSTATVLCLNPTGVSLASSES